MEAQSMKTIVRASLLVLLAMGCGDDQEPEAASALFDRIQEENYRGWDRAPGYETRQPSNTAHSDAVDIFINPAIADALTDGASLGAWPVGSLIVKDGYESGGELALIAAMEKRDDGWFWAEWTDTSGEDAKYSGKPDICIDCHQSGSDHVRAFALP
jgi:hypothetical protein